MTIALASLPRRIEPISGPGSRNAGTVPEARWMLNQFRHDGDYGAEAGVWR
jgi:hypothetical protein